MLRAFQIGVTSCLISIASAESGGGSSDWARPGDSGKLIYKTTPAGDRFMDFSSAGYMGGGVKIPDVKVAKRLTPSGSDDTAAIQEAIDAVSHAEPASGFRGAVLLAPGIFHCSAALMIAADGVVLRGSGTDPKSGTTIALTGTPHVGISVIGRVTVKDVGKAAAITDAYVPSGASSFHVQDASGFATGDILRIRRPVTPAWVAFMGMDKLERNGKPERWVTGQTEMERTITAISGNLITVGIPLSDSLDARFLAPGATVVKSTTTGGFSQIGIEELRLVSPPQSVELATPHNSGINLDGVSDAWVRNVALDEMVGSIKLDSLARRVTVRNIHMNHTTVIKGAAKPADLWTEGTQTLFERCSGNGDALFYFATGGRTTGPNVILNSTFTGKGGIQPHMRWATGLLVDGCKVPGGGIDLMNRGQMGSGHGWTIGWSVAWNCTAKSLIIQQPPGSMNWAIGCIGDRKKAAMPFGKSPLLEEGTYDSPGTPVAPASLYLTQLRDRLGPQAVKDAGY